MLHLEFHMTLKYQYRMSANEPKVIADILSCMMESKNEKRRTNQKRFSGSGMGKRGQKKVVGENYNQNMLYMCMKIVNIQKMNKEKCLKAIVEGH